MTPTDALAAALHRAAGSPEPSWDANMDNHYRPDAAAILAALAASGWTLGPVVSDNQAALESLPYAVQGADLNLPLRVVVDQHGHYWRDYGDFLSMCPVSDENVETEVVAAFTPARTAPDQPVKPHGPGDPHVYETACVICGQPGVVRLTMEPQRSSYDGYDDD